MGIHIVVGDIEKFSAKSEGVFGAFIQYPGTHGEARDPTARP